MTIGTSEATESDLQHTLTELEKGEEKQKGRGEV